MALPASATHSVKQAASGEGERERVCVYGCNEEIKLLKFHPMVQTGMGLFPCHSLHQCLPLRMDLLPYENPRDRLSHSQLPILDFLYSPIKICILQSPSANSWCQDNN